MIERWNAGRDRDHWQRVHDQINGISSPYPPLLTQAGNVIKAAIGFSESWFKIADEAEQGRRIEICHACEFFDHAQGRCRKCGCFGGWKAWIASQKCPIDKW